MKKVMVLLAVIVMAVESFASVVWLGPSQDTYLSKDHPDTSYGSSSTLQWAGATNKQVLVQFDLSAIPAGSIIDDAQIDLYLESENGDAYFYTYQVISAWDENATFNDRTSGTPWNNPGGDFNGSPAYGNGQFFPGDVGDYYTLTSANFKNLVQNWIDGTANNYGLIIQRKYGSTSQNATFTSSEAGSNPPRMRVSYTAIPEPTTVSFLILGVLVCIWKRYHGKA